MEGDFLKGSTTSAAHTAIRGLAFIGFLAGISVTICCIRHTRSHHAQQESRNQKFYSTHHKGPLNTPNFFPYSTGSGTERSLFPVFFRKKYRKTRLKPLKTAHLGGSQARLLASCLTGAASEVPHPLRLTKG
jgi:hypothetical protein